MLQALAMRLSEGIDIQYGRHVRKIAWHASGVDIYCTDGATAQYDAVISTIPLGVLKVHHTGNTCRLQLAPVPHPRQDHIRFHWSIVSLDSPEAFLLTASGCHCGMSTAEQLLALDHLHEAAGCFTAGNGFQTVEPTAMAGAHAPEY